MVLGEEPAGQIDVFGCHPHALAALCVEGGRHVLEVGHGAHVDPGLRHRDDDVGVTEAERRQHGHARVGVGHRLADQILARDAEMHAAVGEARHDLRARQERDLDPPDTLHRAAVVAGAAALLQREARAGADLRRVLL